MIAYVQLINKRESFFEEIDVTKMDYFSIFIKENELNSDNGVEIRNVFIFIENEIDELNNYKKINELINKLRIIKVLKLFISKNFESIILSKHKLKYIKKDVDYLFYEENPIDFLEKYNKARNKHHFLLNYLLLYISKFYYFTFYKEILIKKIIELNEKFEFDDSLLKKRFDFLLIKNDRYYFIELDGKQHFKKIKMFGMNDDILKNNIKIDYDKNKFCFKNGLNLIRIHYKHINAKEEMIYNFLNINKYTNEH